MDKSSKCAEPHIARMDLRILWINILLLTGVGLVPFNTALLGRYPLEPTVIIVCGINGVAVSILYNSHWLSPRLRRPAHNETNPETITQRSRIIIVGPTVYALAIIFACISVYTSLGLYVFIIIYYIIFGGKYTHQWHSEVLPSFLASDRGMSDISWEHVSHTFIVIALYNHDLGSMDLGKLEDPHRSMIMPFL